MVSIKWNEFLSNNRQDHSIDQVYNRINKIQNMQIHELFLKDKLVFEGGGIGGKAPLSRKPSPHLAGIGVSGQQDSDLLHHHRAAMLSSSPGLFYFV